MERGPSVKKKAKSFQEILMPEKPRGKAETQAFPQDGATLFVLTRRCENYDPKNGEVSRPVPTLCSLYSMGATSEFYCLPLKANAQELPWIIGTRQHRANIIDSPSKKLTIKFLVKFGKDYSKESGKNRQLLKLFLNFYYEYLFTANGSKTDDA